MILPDASRPCGPCFHVDGVLCAACHRQPEPSAQNARCHASAEAYHYPSGLTDATGARSTFSRTAGILQLINTTPIFAQALKHSHNYLYGITVHRLITMAKLFSSKRSIFFLRSAFSLACRRHGHARTGTLTRTLVPHTCGLHLDAYSANPENTAHPSHLRVLYGCGANLGSPRPDMRMPATKISAHWQRTFQPLNK